MPHMDEGRLQAWLDGPPSGLSDADRDEIEAHLASCAPCRARLDELRETDAASRDLLGALGAAEPAMPDFEDIVARSDARRATKATPARRRLPLQWAASIVLAVGVGWMANEVVRTDPDAVRPPVPGIPAQPLEDGAPSAGVEGAPGPDDAAAGAAIESPAGPAAVQEPAAVQTSDAAAPTRSAAENVQPAERRASSTAAASRRPALAERAMLEQARTAPPASGTTWVNGRVVTTDGQPVADAVVRIPGTASSALSGTDGRFRMQIATDSLGPDAQLEATYIGYAQARRAVPVGVGELSIGDLRMEPRVIALEGVVVTGTAIAAERREVSVPNRLRVDDSAVWRRVGASDARTLLGHRPYRLPELAWTEIGAVTVGGAEVVRVTHATAGGDVVTLYQSRADVEIDVAPGAARATRTTEDGLHLVAMGPIATDTLADLLERAEEITDAADARRERR